MIHDSDVFFDAENKSGVSFSKFETVWPLQPIFGFFIISSFLANDVEFLNSVFENQAITLRAIIYVTMNLKGQSLSL